MKKLFIIIGKGAVVEESFIRKIADELTNKNHHVEKIYHDDLRALDKTLALLEQDEIKDYGSYAVLYSGTNLRDLKENLPCVSIDASVCFRKSIEVAGGYKTEAEQKLVFDSFLDEIAQVIKK